MASKKAAKTLSLDQQADRIRRAFYDIANTGGEGEISNVWVEETYADHMIVNDAGAYLKVPFSADADGNVMISDRSEWQEVERAWLTKMLACKAKKGGSGLLIHKQADGNYRWFGWVSNQYRDQDNPPEILSAKAHKAFVKWADKSGQYPELWLWHVPGSKAGQADWLEFADGFLMGSGLFDKDKVDIAERLTESKEEFRMSHGFVRLAFDEKDTVTDAYWMYEMSILPVGPEANPWTGFRAVGKGSTMPISEAKKAFLSKYLSAETIKDIEADTSALKTAAEAAGVDWKEVEAIVDETEETPTKTEAPTEPVDVKALANALIGELQLENLSAMVTEIKTKTDAIEALTEKVTALEAVVKGLKKTDDEKVAEAMIPKAVKSLAWFTDAFQASKSDQTKLDDNDPADKRLKDTAPKVSALETFISKMAE